MKSENKKMVAMYLPPWIIEKLKENAKNGVSQAAQVEAALIHTYGWKRP